ncbi:protoporphyrinogen oxidase [bacterium BMS3Abin07]|nr:protoporphyrinogen oxidase [bacterium BMS3Abin07]GBE31779.1 protoporphyrinogen oxidase [bacterium BMS3Bbin05]
MKIVIIGGGISGLSIAYFLLRKEPGLEVEVYESSGRAGGKIWTDRADGFLCESGVNGFLDNRPMTLKLAGDLGLDPLKSNDDSRERYVFSGNKLHLIPESPLAFFSSGFLSLKGRLRILYEPFAGKGSGKDETLESFAVRRLGREAYEKLIDPMASGIYAGDSTALSLKSCFPRIYELEQDYGSLIRAMFRLRKEARKTGKKVSAGPGGVLTSFYNGMQVIIDSLKNSIGNRLRLGKEVLSIDRRDDGYTLHTGDGKETGADLIVLAVPAYSAAKILRDFNGRLSQILSGITYPSVAVVCMGFLMESIPHSLNGFGFLIPARERRKILGTLWDSSIFPNRAPDGHVLLRTMIGGARASSLAMQEDNKIVDNIMGELGTIMGIKSDPDFIKIYRHELAIPQYHLGHQEILREVDAMVSTCRGLYLTGNAYRGIGMNDCIENSYNLCNRILGL